MKRKRKGRVPPHLKRFLFRKGHRTRKAKRVVRRRANPTIRRQAPAVDHFIFARRGGGQRLHFDGVKFTSNGKPVYYASDAQARYVAKELLRKFPVLKTYDVYVSDTSRKH